MCTGDREARIEREEACMDSFDTKERVSARVCRGEMGRPGIDAPERGSVSLL